MTLAAKARDLLRPYPGPARLLAQPVSIDLGCLCRRFSVDALVPGYEDGWGWLHTKKHCGPVKDEVRAPWRP